MREKYHSEAIILRVSDFKESNKLYHLLSERFGFILATAQGVRLSKSKLRFGLQQYSLADVSVVRTGDLWKITNSVPVKNYYFELDNNKERQAAVSRLAAFLLRFLHGEEEDLRIYHDVRNGFELLLEPKTEIRVLEAVLVMRLLFFLGMLEDSAKFENLIGPENIADVLEKAAPDLESILKSVNSSLSQSQL